MCCFNTVSVGPTRVADMCLHDGRVMGASFSNTYVNIWSIDLLVSERGRKREKFEEEKDMEGWIAITDMCMTGW